MKYEVDLSRVKKQLKAGKLPPQVRRKLKEWAELIDFFGLEASRRVRGFNDEQVTGQGDLRSVRLGRSWRLFYKEIHGHQLVVVRVEKVTHHVY
jgi:hypothetical protein